MLSVPALTLRAERAARPWPGWRCARAWAALLAVSLWSGTAAAQFVVTDTGDGVGASNDVTLRYAITQANANPSGTNTISFAPSLAHVTLTLNGNLPPIAANVTIDASAIGGLTINGAGRYSAFFIDSGTVAIKNLTIANTNAVGGGGGNAGSQGGGGGGGLGAGGALFVNSAATVTIQNVSFSGNAGSGGAGGNSAGSGGGGGGGGGGFHGAGGSSNGDGGGGGGGFQGAGGTTTNVLSYAGGGGGGLFGNGAANGGYGGGGGGGSLLSGSAGSQYNGGAGGVTGGGNGGSYHSTSPGAGGSGAGGGGGAYLQSGANGGKFGGGGGNGYNSTGTAGQGGDFGGGGGGGRLNAAANSGGFGGGGGGGSLFGSANAAGGFGGGAGGAGATGGNGGDALGGAVFVRTGGSLTIIDSGISGSSVTAGQGGSGSTQGTSGTTAGAALYAMSGVNATIKVGSGSQTISDSIGGAGGFSKTGTGTLVLSGTNNYSGGTTVSAGTLQGNTTSLQGAITNNAAVAFNQATDGTYAGAMSGSGTLTKSGAGTLTLTGTNTYSGTTDITAGKLLVDGSIASGTPSTTGTTVENGATLGGAGTINGNVVSHGNVAPGDPVTMTINGNYTQAANGNMQVAINNAGNTPGVNNSLLVVTGTANLAGTVEVQPAAGSYAGGTRYIFLEANALAGSFSGITLDGLINMQAVLGYGTIGGLADAFFTLQADLVAAAQTPNQLAVANYIDANSGDPALQSLIATLNTLSPAGMRSAFDQLSGAIYGSVTQTDFQSSTLELSFIIRRLGDGLMSSNTGGLARNSYGDQVQPTALAANDSGLIVRGQNPNYWPLRRPTSGWTTWGFGYGLSGNAQGNSNAAGLNYSLGGTVVGLETADNNRIFGAYAGYVGSHLGSYLAGQSIGVNGGQSGLYLRGDDGRNYYILLGGLGADGYNSRRLMQFGGINTTANANYGGWSSQLYLERGLTFQGYKGTIQPYAALQYLYTRQNSFTETGAGVMNLKVNGIDANSLRSLVGVRLAANSWYVNDRAITPVARALWLHEFLSTNTGLNAQFAPIGGGSFAVTGTSLGRDWAILGTGLNWNLGGGWQAYANYDAQVNLVQTFHVGSGGFQYSW